MLKEFKIQIAVLLIANIAMALVALLKTTIYI